MTELAKIVYRMNFDTQIINNAIKNADVLLESNSFEEYLKIKKEEIKINSENAINDTIDLIDRANKRLLAWKSVKDFAMVEQWTEIKEKFEYDLNDLQKEYDLIFGK